MSSQIADPMTALSAELKILCQHLLDDRPYLVNNQMEILEQRHEAVLLIRNRIQELTGLIKDNQNAREQWAEIEADALKINELIHVNQNVVENNRNYYQQIYNGIIQSFSQENTTTYNERAELNHST